MKKSVLKGRSFCPRCKKKINWYDNIPLVSYLFLGGKCRKCRKRISIRYPLLEISTGLLFLGTYMSYQSCFNGAQVNETLVGGLVCKWSSASPILGLLLLIALVSVLVSIFIIDIEHMIIPDSLLFSAFLVFYVFTAIIFSEQLFTLLLTGTIASLFLLTLNLATLGRGMGAW